MSKQLKRGPEKGDVRVGRAKLEETSCSLSPLAQAGNHPCMRMILLLQAVMAGQPAGSPQGQARGPG